MASTKARACDGKIRHANRAAALVHITRLARDEGAAWWRFEAYRCRHCSPLGKTVWHVGHRRSRR